MAQRSAANASTEIKERRVAVRKPFIAEALVVEVNSGAKLSGRSCDLVVQGCYVDTLNPLPQGTVVRVRLQHGDSRVESNGTVVYQVPGLGMGIAFHDLTVENQATLNEWLSNASDADGVFQASLPPIQVQRSMVPRQREERLVQLIEVLRKKGILTTREAAALLQEPVIADL